MTEVGRKLRPKSVVSDNCVLLPVNRVTFGKILAIKVLYKVKSKKTVLSLYYLNILCYLCKQIC